jgi:hypothetical protein
MKLVLCPHFTAHIKDTNFTESVTVVCDVCGPNTWRSRPGNRPVDWSQDPGFQEYAQHVRDELIPMIKDSAVALSLVPPDGVPDVKFAVELGYMIMLDKPIISILRPGAEPSAKLCAVTDEFVEGEMDQPDFQQRLIAAMARVRDKIPNEEEQDGNQDQQLRHRDTGQGDPDLRRRKRRDDDHAGREAGASGA